MSLAAAAAGSAIGGGSMVHRLDSTGGFINWRRRRMAAVPDCTKLDTTVQCAVCRDAASHVQQQWHLEHTDRQRQNQIGVEFR